MRVVIELKKDAVAGGRPEQPLQDDAAAGVVRRQHARDRRRAARRSSSSSRRCRTSSSTAATSSPAARCSSCAQAARRGCDIVEGLEDRRRQHRRGHRPHPLTLEGHRGSRPELAGRRGRATRRACFALRAAGAGDPRHAPRQADRPRAREARGRDQGARARSSTRLEDILADEASPHGGHRRRARGDQDASYGDKRRTEIVDDEGEIADEDMIPRRTWSSPSPTPATSSGTRSRSYRAQRRGGRGITGAATHEEDFVAAAVRRVDARHLLMFTDKGASTSRRSSRSRGAARTAKGKAIVNFVGCRRASRSSRIAAGARVLARARSSSWPPSRGTVKKTELTAFANIRQNGITASTIEDGDRLWSARASPRARRHPPRDRARAGDPLPRGQVRADGPRAARRARHRAARATIRSSAWRSSRATTPATCSRCASTATASARHSGVPDQEPRRQGRHPHQDHRAQRPGGRRRSSATTTT